MGTVPSHLRYLHTLIHSTRDVPGGEGGLLLSVVCNYILEMEDQLDCWSGAYNGGVGRYGRRFCFSHF